MSKTVNCLRFVLSLYPHDFAYISNHAVGNRNISSCSIYHRKNQSSEECVLISHKNQKSCFIKTASTIFLFLFNKKPGTTLPGTFYGGADEDRTRDLLVANETLSQLSYSPRTRIDSIKKKKTFQFKINTQESRNKIEQGYPCS